MIRFNCELFLYVFPVVIFFAAQVQAAVYKCDGFQDLSINYVNATLDGNSTEAEADPSRYSIQNDTRGCNALYQESIHDDDLPTCHPGMATMNVAPLLMTPKDVHYHPFVTMNITVDVFETTIDRVFIRMECLQASDMTDAYCHRQEELVQVSSQVISPCRSVDLDGSMPVVPFRFSYSCFHMFGLSHYRVNATLWPTNCRLSLIVSIPYTHWVFPEIGDAKNRTNNWDPDWAPLIAVDTGEEDGVWIRITPPPNRPWKEVRISIAEQSHGSDSELSIVEKFTITFPATGVKWRDVSSGRYTIFAHLPRHDCSLICLTGTPNCNPCRHTPLNFTLTHHKASVPWKAVRAVRDAGFYVAIFLIAIVAFVGVGGCALLAYMRRRALKNPHSFELINRPTVLLVFADDCQEHNGVVVQLSRTIARLANAIVLLDQQELLSTGVKPSRWLIEHFASASRVLVVLSPSVPSLIESDKVLSQRRPFPDLFLPAFDMMISEIATRHNRDKFVLLRLPYSPPTPDQIRVLNLATFEIPSELVTLTTHLHGVHAAAVSHPFEVEERDAVERAITQFNLMARTNPNWLESRLIERDFGVVKLEIENVPVSKPRSELKAEQNARAAEYGMLQPPSDSEEEDEEVPFAGGHRLQLLEAPDSDSD